MEPLIAKALKDALYGFSRAIFAVYRSEEAVPFDKFEHIGTCFAIAYRGRQFLVTAGHVLDHQTGGCLGICSAAQHDQQLTPIRGTWYVADSGGGDRASDPLDYAWHELTEDEGASLRCIQETALEDSRMPLTGQRLFVATGFPVSKNKIRAQERLGKRFTPKLAQYANVETTPSDYFKKRDMSPQTHIAIERGKRSMDVEDKADNTIGHRGLSGGPLIYMGLSDAASSIEDQRVAGIIIEGHERLIVALRLSVVLRHIDRILVTD